MKARKAKRFMALVLAVVLIATGSISAGFTSKADSCGGLEQEDLYTPGSDEVIKDPALHWAIRSTLNAIKARPKLTAELVGSKQVMNISYALCAHPEDFEGWEKQYWIEDLTGLQYATSAKIIEICYTNEEADRRIRDLSPLSGLSQLQTLILMQDGIDDISPLSGLTGLEKLDVSGNKEISDASSVASMKKLKILVLAGNKITDIGAVKDLETLEYLDVSSNQIASLPDLSKLKNVQTFKASNNNLKNDDVKKIAGMRGIRTLDLKGNTSITDIKPLARLIYLDRSMTFLPVSDAETDNLFAAIEVNKLFNKFNISKMKSSDLQNVEKALAAYDALNVARKAYFDAGRIRAARENKRRVEEGLEPTYYEEYDEDGEAQPVLDRLLITVVDKKGAPMPGISFIKKVVGTKEISTDENGMLEIVHQLNDGNFDPSVVVKGDAYVSIPERFEYEVKNGKTYIVNGKRVTGFEKHQIMLIPKNEYVDKSQLKAALESAEKVEEEYKYTAASYKTYSDALKAAQAVYNNADATKGNVDTAAANLKNAVSALRKTDILTELKLIVKDVNGNQFTRPFKFQVYVTGTKAEAWNQLSDAETGTAYLQASPGWQDNKAWTVVPCYEEPYTFDPINLIVGVKNGQRYYKTVDGKSVGPDFEKVVTVKARPGGAEDKENERKPESSVLKKRIEAAKLYEAAGYTENTFASLQTAIRNAQTTAEKTGASQEEYNAAAAALKKAENDLAEQANTIALEKALDRYIGYTADYYVSNTWKKYNAEYISAKAIYENKNATQQEVDSALSRLKAAEASLVMKADKRELEKKLNEAKALKAEDYIGGYDKLQTAIAEAQIVYDNTDATEAEAETALNKLQSAIDALQKKPVERDYECYPTVFRALVKDNQEKPLANVKFQIKVEGVSSTESVITDKDGILEYYIDGGHHGKRTTVSLADRRYTTTDEHWFVTGGISQWVFSITTIDDQNYQDGIKLTYTLESTGIENPDPEPTDPDPTDPNPVDPAPGQADKNALKEQIDIADSIRNKGSSYSAESFNAMLAALEEALEVFEDESASAEVIAACTQKLKKAREELKAIEKPVVTDKSAIRILLKDKDGNRIKEKIGFYMIIGSGRPLTMYSNNGVLEYEMTDADQGVKTITVFAPEEGIEYGGEKYIVSPSQHEFAIDASSIGVYVVEVDGKELKESGQEVSFVLAEETLKPEPEEPEPEEPEGPEEPGPEKPEPEKPDSEKPQPEKKPQPIVTVKDTVKVSKINITGLSKKISAGKKIALKASVFPANASNKNITWKSSNTKVATVDAKGVVTLKKKSGGKKVTITAMAADGSGVKASYSITSMKNPVKKISISGAKAVKAGKSLKLKAKVSASKGANKKVSWTSSNTKYAKVSASGKVKTYKAGKGKKVKITAKATDGSGKRKTVTIKIK